MNPTAAEQIAKAVLYEGYMLYPYRPSAVKNQQRFNFGVLYPQAFSEAQKGLDPYTLHSECLVQGAGSSRLQVRLRFLQLVERSIEEASGCGFHAVKSLTVDGQTFYSWQEAMEREQELPASRVDDLLQQKIICPMHLPASTSVEILNDSRGTVAGRIVRTQSAVDGSLVVEVHATAEDVFKITLRVANVTAIDDAANVSRNFALLRSLVSAHLILGVEGGGQFVSLLDAPAELRLMAEACHNHGVFPVLVGEARRRDTMLVSPIILYDYPQIAPESAGDLFDGTEIDEILSLRILTMTDDEKREMRESDERAREMLQRTESMPAEQFMKLHGALRGLRRASEEAR